MSAFNSTLHPVKRSAVEPMLRFLNLGEGERVFAASKWTSLEGTEAIGDNREENLLRQAIDAILIDWAVLELDIDRNAAVWVANNPVMMVSATCPRLIKN